MLDHGDASSDNLAYMAYDVAAYRAQAKAEGHSVLAYLLDMAHAEIEILRGVVRMSKKGNLIWVDKSRSIPPRSATRPSANVVQASR